MPLTRLVVHQAALGDSILILPLLKCLAQDGPVLLAMPWSKARLLQRLLPAIIPCDIETRFWTQLHGDQPERLTWPPADTRLPIDRILSFVSDGHDHWATNIQTIAPQTPCDFILPKPAATWTGHVTTWHHHQLPPLFPPLFPPPVYPPVYPLSHPPPLRLGSAAPSSGQSPDSPTRQPPASKPSGVILIHPGSGGQAKCWPIERYRQLIHRLMQNGFPVRVIGGEAEAHRWDRFAFPCETRLLADLDQLADAIACASFFIGNDSGPTHLAAQMGLPTLALFGPSRCDHWHPIGPKAAWLCPPEPCAMDWLSVQQVYHAVVSHPFGFE